MSFEDEMAPEMGEVPAEEPDELDLEAIIRELYEETRFPIDEFRAAFKEGRMGMKQVKTYTEPKRDSWNFW